MIDDSISELRREIETLGADIVTLVETYSSTSRQRADAFELSAGVTVGLRLGWDLGQWADRSKSRKVWAAHALISLSLSTATRQVRRVDGTVGAGRTSSGVCMQSDNKIANRGRWTRSLRCVRYDQCQFGMTSVDSVGNVRRTYKVTWFMTGASRRP